MSNEPHLHPYGNGSKQNVHSLCSENPCIIWKTNNTTLKLLYIVWNLLLCRCHWFSDPDSERTSSRNRYVYTDICIIHKIYRTYKSILSILLKTVKWKNLVRQGSADFYVLSINSMWITGLQSLLSATWTLFGYPKNKISKKTTEARELATQGNLMDKLNGLTLCKLSIVYHDVPRGNGYGFLVPWIDLSIDL